LVERAIGCTAPVGTSISMKEACHPAPGGVRSLIVSPCQPCVGMTPLSTWYISLSLQLSVRVSSQKYVAEPGEGTPCSARTHITSTSPRSIRSRGDVEIASFIVDQLDNVLAHESWRLGSDFRFDEVIRSFPKISRLLLSCAQASSRHLLDGLS
jgi:hypothetical protein